MDSIYAESLSKHELSIIADMTDVILEKTLKKDKIFNILGEYYKEVYDESPFKSIISDFISILPKKGCKKIKKHLKYIEEIKELTSLQIENGKNSLVKLRNDLVEKYKKNNRIKKADREYYGYEDNKFYGLKDIRNLFDQNDDIYEEIGYLFNEPIILYEMKQNGLEYEQIEKLMSI